MDILDFSSLVKLIKNHLTAEVGMYEEDLEYYLFNSYIKSENGINHDQSTVSRWLSRDRAISKDIVEYYSKIEGGKFCTLAPDFKKHVLSILLDPHKFAEDAKELLENDRTISPEKKGELMKHYSTDTREAIAEFIAQLLYFSINRNNLQAMKKVKKYLEEGRISPFAKEHINGNSIPLPCSYFEGRSSEIEAIHNCLVTNRHVFVQGISGIGKSELAKAYIQKYSNEYANVLYVKYSGDLKESLLNLTFVQDLPDDSNEVLWERRKWYFSATCEDTLVVIDNFNTTSSQDEFLSTFLEYGCRTIFTTRSRWDDYSCINVREFTDIDTLLRIMESIYKDGANCRKILKKIIKAVHNHTYSVVMSAKLLSVGKSSPKELLKKIKSQRMSLNVSDKISIKKDGVSRKATYYEHMNTLFSLYSLNDVELEILRNLSLISLGEVNKHLFSEWMNLPDFNIINDLIEKGLVEPSDEKHISMYPMIQEMLVDRTAPSIENCAKVINGINEICIDFTQEIAFRRQLLVEIESIIINLQNDYLDDYLKFLENAFDYMQKYDYKYGMRLVVDKMGEILEDENIGDNRHRALHLDYSTYFLKDTEDKIKLQKAAIKILGEINASNAHLASNLYNNLGELYDQIEDSIHAEEYIEKARSLLKEFNQKSIFDEITQEYNKAVLLVKKDKLSEALSILEILAENMQKSKLIDIIEYAIVCDLLGDLLAHFDRIPEALQMYTIALSIYEKAYKDEPKALKIHRANIKKNMNCCNALMAGKAVLKYPSQSDN